MEINTKNNKSMLKTVKNTCTVVGAVVTVILFLKGDL